MLLLPRLFQHLQQRIGRLRAGHAVLVLDHEERHAGDAVGTRLGLVGPHLGGVPVAVQDGADLVAVQTAPRPRSRPGWPGRPPLRPSVKVAAEQPLLQLALDPAVGGQVQQAVGVEGVAGLGDVEVVVQAFLGGASRSWRQHRRRAFCTGAQYLPSRAA